MSAFANAFVPALGWALIDFLWQGVLLGLLVLPLLGLLRNARPQARYALLLAALLACALLPLIGLVRGLESSGAPVAAAQVSPFIAPQFLDDAGSAPSQAWQVQWQSWLPWVVAFWSLGSSLLALRFTLGLRWIARTRHAGVLPGFEWQARLERLSAAIGLANPPSLRLVDGLHSPVVAGWWRPVVMLPAALVARMPAELLEALLAHELAHVRRHDYLINLLQGVVEALLFYHPVVWWLSRQVRIEREQIADDLASKAIGQPRPLALALQQLERLQAGLDHPVPHAHLAPAAHGGHLMNRIKRLIRPTPSSLHWKSGLPLLGVAALCLAVYAQATPRAPGAGKNSVVLAPVASVLVDEVALPVAAAAPVARAQPAAQPAAIAAVDAVAAADVAAPAAAAEAADPVAALDAEAVERPQAATDDDVVQFLDDRREQPYALVREDQDTLLLSGDSKDREEVRKLRRQVEGDFIWFRKDGKSYLVQDPQLVAKAAEAWAPAQALGEKMQALGDQMAPHSRQMEALARQMQDLAGKDLPQREQMEAASRQMQPLAERQQQLAEQMKGLSVQMIQAERELDRERLQRDMDQLQRQMEPLNRQMSELGARLGEQSRRLQSQRIPMQQLSEQMHRNSEPMKQLGEKLGALAKQQERLSHQADAQVQQLIEQALREDKARPKAR